MTPSPSLEATRAALARAARDEAAARAAVDAAHRSGEKRRPLPVLERLYIASPCSVPWDSMKGDDRVRFCGQCEKSVYNVSAMNRAEAEALLQGPAELPCVRFYQRTDGTILTADCPVGVVRKLRLRWAAAMMTVAATVLASIGMFFGRRPDALASRLLQSSAEARSRVSDAPVNPVPVAGGPMMLPEPKPLPTGKPSSTPAKVSHR